MKYQPFKSFGYPVLTPCKIENLQDADYVDYNFEPSIAAQVHPDFPKLILIQVDLYGMPPSMLGAIKQKNAVLLLYLTCRSTFFSKCFVIDNAMGVEVVLEGDLLSGEVELSIFIRAEKGFILSDGNINPEFGYNEFDVSKGMILAQSAITPIYVQKEFYRNPKSIVSINVDRRLKDGEFTLSLENQFIEVSTSEKLNKLIGELGHNESTKLHAINCLYVPVITQALDELEKNPDLLEHKWAQVLTQQLQTTESYGEIRPESHNKSQALFKFPLSKISMEAL